MRFAIPTLVLALAFGLGACASAPSGEESPATRALVTTAGNYRVAVRSDPAVIPRNEPFELAVEVRAADGGAPPSDLVLEVSADMPEHGHGTITRPVTTPVGVEGGGDYVVRGLLLHMPGRWEIYFDLARGGRTERAWFELDLR